MPALPQLPAEVLARYDFSRAVYTGALKPITGVVCPKHGEFRQYSAQFRKLRGCPQCGSEQRVKARTTPAEDYVRKVAEIHGGRYDYTDTVFVKMNAKINVRCPEHGVFTISANHHYYRKQGCGLCEAEAKRERIVKYRHLSAPSKVANTAATFFERCTLMHDGRYTYPEQEYLGAKHKIRAVCAVHGEFEQAAWKHMTGSGCPSCGAYTPAWERELVAFFSALGFQVQTNVPLLAGREIDVYLPERKFGVELHGLHWHTERTRARLYHYEKWAEATRQDIQLIQVFEDEWNASKALILARLEAILGCGQRFSARKGVGAPLEAAPAKEFLNRTHIQGAGTAQMYYGLHIDGQLVAVASFGRARAGGMTSVTEADVWEVIRYASLGRVRGGFGKLFARFLKDVAPEEVISFCDLRYGDGRLYAATGFTLERVTPPDYWWVPPGSNTRVPRYATQKHKLPTHPVLGQFYAPGKTEAQVCAGAGWERIFGVGHQRWLWRKELAFPSRA